MVARAPTPAPSIRKVDLLVKNSTYISHVKPQSVNAGKYAAGTKYFESAGIKTGASLFMLLYDSIGKLASRDINFTACKKANEIFNMYQRHDPPAVPFRAEST